MVFGHRVGRYRRESGQVDGLQGDGGGYGYGCGGASRRRKKKRGRKGEKEEGREEGVVKAWDGTQLALKALENMCSLTDLRARLTRAITD